MAEKKLGMFNVVGNIAKGFVDRAKESGEPGPKTNSVKELAIQLHPAVQYLVVTAVDVFDENCKTFTLEAAPGWGRNIAHMNAGNYICVYLDIDGMKLTRPYSISSSPRMSSQGKYTITVKRVKDGIGSNYILDNWDVGTLVTASGPQGTFEYESVRDASTVIGIAGGSGITPFYSFAQAIADGDEDFNLVVLFGSRTEKDILFKDEFNAIMAKTDKVKVVHVLSDEKKDGYENGFITGELIKKYMPNGDVSIFLCGPEQMYAFVDKELEPFGLERKWIRHEGYEIHGPEKFEGYPATVPETVKITVHMCDETYVVKADTSDTILVALEKGGVRAPSRCRAGECGWCHSRVISGAYFIPKGRDYRRAADEDFGYIHPCCTYALTDMELEIAYTE